LLLAKVLLMRAIHLLFLFIFSCWLCCGSAHAEKRVALTYVKTPNIDLTSRVRPYAELTGIEIPAAEVPPGEHLIRMEVHDSEGRRTTTTFVLNIAP
jgi:hypothetical protein